MDVVSILGLLFSTIIAIMAYEQRGELQRVKEAIDRELAEYKKNADAHQLLVGQAAAAIVQCEKSKAALLATLWDAERLIRRSLKDGRVDLQKLSQARGLLRRAEPLRQELYSIGVLLPPVVSESYVEYREESRDVLVGLRTAVTALRRMSRERRTIERDSVLGYLQSVNAYSTEVSEKYQAACAAWRDSLHLSGPGDK